MSIIRRSLQVSLVAAVFVAGPRSGMAQAKEAVDLVATAKASGNYTMFAKLVEEAGLAPMLRGTADFTVFAPTDAAFGKWPKEKLEGLERDTAELKKVLLLHVVSGVLPANKVLNLKNARTMSGAKVDFSVKEARLRVNGVVIVQPDIKASNGIIHGIEAVLVLPK